MTETSFTYPGLQAILGKDLPPDIFDVEKGHIRRFAEAVGDTANLLYRDLEYARKSPYGTIIAPPMFLVDIALNKMAYLMMEHKPANTGFLNGGLEIDYYTPIRLGDVITSTARLTDLQVKTSKRGRLLIMVVELTFRNQKGELVQKFKDTFIAPENK